MVPAPPSNGAAVASLVLGVVAIAVGVWALVPIIGVFASALSFVPALLAVTFGYSGLSRAQQVGVGRGAAMGGLWTGWVTLALIAGTTLFWVTALMVGSAASV
jgi:cell shape-determining protein MreD